MTMIGGDYEDVLVMSGPPGARARAAECDETCTPGVLRLARKRDHVLELSRPGHAPRTVHIASRHDPARWVGSFVLNFFAFGWWSGGIGMVIGVTVDVVHGSVKELEPDAVFVPLLPEPRREAAPAGESVPAARPPAGEPVKSYGLPLR
jgi:hypothetical protein